MLETESSESDSSNESVEFSQEYDDDEFDFSEDNIIRELDNRTCDNFLTSEDYLKCEDYFTCEDVLTSEDRIRKVFEQKGMKLLGDETRWRESVREQLESEINRRVREALETPPFERAQKRNVARQQRESPDINEHLLLEPRVRNKELMGAKRWRSVQDNKLSQKDGMTITQGNEDQEPGFSLLEDLHHSNPEMSSMEFKHCRILDGVTDIRDKNSLSINRFPELKPRAPSFHTKKGFIKTLRNGNLPTEVQAIQEYTALVDKYGVIRNSDGPFWPAEFVPLFATPRFKWWTEVKAEPLHNLLSRFIDSFIIAKDAPAPETEIKVYRKRSGRGVR